MKLFLIFIFLVTGNYLNANKDCIKSFHSLTDSKVSDKFSETFHKAAEELGLDPNSKEAQELFLQVKEMLLKSGVNLKDPIASIIAFKHFWKKDLVRRTFPLKFRPKDRERYEELKKEATQRRLTLDEFKELHEILNLEDRDNLAPETGRIPIKKGVIPWIQSLIEGYRPDEPIPQPKYEIRKTKNEIIFPNGIRAPIKKVFLDGSLLVEIPYGNIIKTQGRKFFTPRFSEKMATTTKIDKASESGQFEAVFYEDGTAEIGDAHHRVTAYALRHSPDGYRKIETVLVPLKLRKSSDGKYWSFPIEWITISLPYSTKDFLGEKMEQ